MASTCLTSYHHTWLYVTYTSTGSSLLTTCTFIRSTIIHRNPMETNSKRKNIYLASLYYVITLSYCESHVLFFTWLDVDCISLPFQSMSSLSLKITIYSFGLVRNSRLITFSIYQFIYIFIDYSPIWENFCASLGPSGLMFFPSI